MIPSRDISRLIEIMAALRSPTSGCAWDLAQTLDTLVPFVLEEAHEVVDAIERGDREDLRDELGDLLLQVVFQARLAEEEGAFDFGGVVEAITTKLIRRHPHIFGDKRDLSADDVRRLWSDIKSQEKALRRRRAGAGSDAARGGLLAAVPAGLPALSRSLALQTQAAKVGFDWQDPRAVLDKIREETREAEAALDDGPALAEEIGDLMFAVVNLARHAKIDAEAALRAANRKFERRFGFIESSLAERGSELETAGLALMEELWTAAKQSERQAANGTSPASPEVSPRPDR